MTLSPVCVCVWGGGVTLTQSPDPVCVRAGYSDPVPYVCVCGGGEALTLSPVCVCVWGGGVL